MAMNNVKPNGYWTKERCEKEASKYNTRIEFQRGSCSAYHSARINAWLDDICGHMINNIKSNGYWTRERCQEVALKYKSRSDLYKANNGVYRRALRKGWLDEICSHMKYVQAPNGYWNYERCKEVASKYNSRTAFQNANRSAYDSARTNGWVDEICSHMKVYSKPRRYWTYERCKEVALKYPSRISFKEGENKSAYSSALSNGWLDDICSHMTRPKSKRKSIWTYDKCQEEALKFNNRTEFSRGSHGYEIARKNGWLDEICSHMAEFKKPNGYWTYDRCKEEALKYEHRSTFMNDCFTAYSASRRNGWLDEICSHMTPKASLKNRYVYAYEFTETKSVYIGLTWKINDRQSNHKTSSKSSVFKYIKKNSLTDKDYEFRVIGYFDMNIAGDIENKTVEEYSENGWIILNRMKAGGLGGGVLKWTKEKCKEEALKYKQRTDFRNGSSSAYGSALRNGWLDEICSHMAEFKKPNGYWTYDRCKEEALKYEHRIDFQNSGSGACQIARKNGWVDDICLHMTKPLTYNFKWSLENCKEEALKYKTRNDFRRKSSGCYMTATKNGWLDVICSHMKRPPSNRLKWTKEKCQEEALKYKTRGEFQKGSGGAWFSVQKNGWLDVICSHMKRPPSNRLKWTKEKCKEEALKYNTRTEFQKGSEGAYRASLKNGWLVEFFPKVK